MRYTITSSAMAQDELAQFWLNSAERQAITQAAYHIDQTLKTNPLLGTSIDGGYTLSIGVLTVFYEFSPDDMLVTIRQYLYHGN